MSFTLLALAGCQSMPKVAQETPNQAFSAETESGEAQERLNQINFKQLKKEQNRPIIALVLGSGGARGYAHIGAIQVLEQSGIRPDFIVGTSAGSIVGSLYASGKNANQIRDIALNMKASDVRDIRLDMKGFFDGQKVEDYVNEQVSDMPLQSLPIPMYVVATQLKEGKKVVLVRTETSPEDIIGMLAAQGILTARGGMTSHAAVVARGMGKCCVAGAGEIVVDEHAKTVTVKGKVLNEGDIITLDGSTGEVFNGALAVVDPELS